MNFEEQILKKLDHLTQEVAQLKAAVAQASTGTSGAPGASALVLPEAPHPALTEQLALSGENLAKWLKSLDRLMELKEDLMPLGRPMMEEAIAALDQATHGFDVAAFKELVRQFVQNLSSLSEALRMLGGLMELKNDASPILKDAFEELVGRLAALKEAGFFASMNKLLWMMERVGQELLVTDLSEAKPVKGVSGLYFALRKKEVQEGLGVLMHILGVLSVLKKS